MANKEQKTAPVEVKSAYRFTPRKQISPVMRARNSLILTNPFFASLLLQQKPIETDAVETLAVDGDSIFINNKWAETLQFDHLKTALVQASMHLCLGHHYRMGSRDDKDWQKSCDYAINPMLKEAGFILPPKAWCEDVYKNLSAESIYKIIHDENKKDGDGDGPSDAGQPNPNIAGVKQAKNGKQAEEKSRIQVKQAENFARAQGQLPEHITREIEKQNAHKVNWREIVAKFISEVAHNDYDWSKSDRRFIHRNIVLPDLYNETTGKLVCVIDTSGSVSAEECEKMIAEIFNCLDTLLEQNGAATLTVVYCDAEVQGVQVLEGPNDKPKVLGGGGTDFKAALSYITEDKNNEFTDVKAVLYLTDGFCESWGESFDIPLLWCCTTDNGLTDYLSKCPFGEKIRFDIQD